MQRRTILLAPPALLIVSSAGAHTADDLAGKRGPNGGQLRATASWHLELVVKGDELMVFVNTHEDKPVSTRGATGRVSLLLGAERSDVLLEPFAQNGLRGSGKFSSDPKLRAVVSVTLAGGKPQQERFEPFRPVAATK